jgi:hypothetical protein
MSKKLKSNQTTYFTTALVNNSFDKQQFRANGQHESTPSSIKQWKMFYNNVQNNYVYKNMWYCKIIIFKKLRCPH